MKTEKQRENMKFVLIIAIIMLIILFIFLIKFLTKSEEKFDIDIDTIKCIGENTIFYSSKTCGHCYNQILMFGEYIDYMNGVDCTINSTLCVVNNITRVPTWVIYGEKYEGVYSFEELRNMTKC